MSNDKAIRFMTAKHKGKVKTLSMCAFARLIGVSEYFIRNKKIRTDMTDQQIIDAAVAVSSSCSTVETARKKFLFRGAKV